MNDAEVINATIEYIRLHDDDNSTITQIQMAHARFLIRVRKALEEAPEP